MWRTETVARITAELALELVAVPLLMSYDRGGAARRGH
jgi:hypothetical protein